MKHLKQLRKRAGITQCELAQALCTGQPTVAMWEAGKRAPRAEKLPKLAKVLGCSMEELF